MADTLLELQAKKEERADQVRRYVDEYAALALEADRIKQRMDWLKGQFETMATAALKDTKLLSISYWGSQNSRVTVTNTATVKPISLTMVKKVLGEVARALSSDVRFLSSEKRKNLHLAAVFACNFTNHMYALAEKILEEQQIPGEVLLPLIDETAAKVHVMSPAQAQTGPAIRYDENVINKHMAMLKDPDMRNLYELISRSIHKEARHE